MKHPKYKESWSKSAANEFGRLANGLADGRIEKPTKTIHFIKKRKCSRGQKERCDVRKF